MEDDAAQEDALQEEIRGLGFVPGQPDPVGAMSLSPDATPEARTPGPPKSRSPSPDRWLVASGPVIESAPPDEHALYEQ